MKVVALVVTYNRRQLLTGCLEGVFGQTRPVDHLFIVDNASTDGTGELLGEGGYVDRRDVTLLRGAHRIRRLHKA